jgi:succinate dehydrogenase hydrophobic anchor subunit
LICCLIGSLSNVLLIVWLVVSLAVWHTVPSLVVGVFDGHVSFKCTVLKWSNKSTDCFKHVCASKFWLVVLPFVSYICQCHQLSGVKQIFSDVCVRWVLHRAIYHVTIAISCQQYFAQCKTECAYDPYNLHLHNQNNQVH